MRWSLPAAIALSLMSSAAAARPHPRQPVEDGDFWRDLLEPHAAEVASLLERSQAALESAGELHATAPGDVARHDQLLSKAYRMLRHAQALSPEQPDVLRSLGVVADELGDTRAAIEALEHAAQLEALERVNVEVADRLGTIYLKQDKLDDAVRWLRCAVASRARGDRAAAAVHLASALAMRGEITAAIELLHDMQSHGNLLSQERMLPAFALAVIYDRDEQPGAAFAVLEQLQTYLQQDASELIERALLGLGFAPAEDEYYYLAMFDELTGHLIAARAQWAMYAAIPGAPWRRRALEHIAAIDAQRKLTPPDNAKPPVRR